VYTTFRRFDVCHGTEANEELIYSSSEWSARVLSKRQVWEKRGNPGLARTQGWRSGKRKMDCPKKEVIVADTGLQRNHGLSRYVYSEYIDYT
jgi:hypothetical protein